MRLGSENPTRRRRAWIAAPIVAGALAVLASACGTTPSSSTGTTTAPTSSASAAALLKAGLAAQNAGNYDVAIADYKKVVAANPSSSEASFANYDLGDIAQINQNDPAAAENYYRAALAVNPNFASALYNLAILLTASQPLIAENNYRQVIAIQPNNADAHLNLGFILLGQNEKGEAKKEFQKAIALQPSLASRIPAGDV